MFAHAIGVKHFKNLVTHFNQNGLMPRTHGNSTRLPANTVPLSVSKDIVQFISNFLTLHALPLPGRMPGYLATKRLFSFHLACQNGMFAGSMHKLAEEKEKFLLAVGNLRCYGASCYHTFLQ